LNFAGVVFIDGFECDPQVAAFLHKRIGFYLIVPGHFIVTFPFGHGGQFTHAAQGHPSGIVQRVEVDDGNSGCPPFRQFRHLVNNRLIQGIGADRRHGGGGHIRKHHPVALKHPGHFVVAREQEIHFTHTGERSNAFGRVNAKQQRIRGLL